MALRPGGGPLRNTPLEELYELRRLADKHIADWQAVVDRIDVELQKRGITPPSSDASK